MPLRPSSYAGIWILRALVFSFCLVYIIFMKRLHSKPCPYCGALIYGRKRADREAYSYSPRCPDCTRKALDPQVLETRRKVLAENRVSLPVGSKRQHKSSDGFTYVRIKIAEPNVWEYEHRIVAGAAKGEHVHHINNNTLDNRPENLLLVLPEAHRAEHKLTQWSRKYLHCQKCGTTKKKHMSHGLCTTCYQQK